MSGAFRATLIWSSPLAAAIGLCFLAFTCADEAGHRYDNPDSAAAILVSPARNEGKGRRSWHEVSLKGSRPAPAPEETGHPPKSSVTLGGFDGDWAFGSIAWIDTTTVNICPLRGDPSAKHVAVVLATETTRRSYRITTDCARTRRAPRVAPYAAATPSDR